jgi:ribosomal protein L11 methyltransferase
MPASRREEVALRRGSRSPFAVVTKPLTEPHYPYVTVDVGPAESDEASALLFELGAQGVEERDATTLARGEGDAGTVTLVASFETAAEAQQAFGELPTSWSPRVGEVIGDAWRDEWKKHFEPFSISDGIVVRPPWRDYTPTPGERVVVLEPGRAFGTGLHETTSLVAQVLGDYAATVRGASVLDVGCGSGILAIVALALGAESARAVDVDPEAVAVTRENAERNGMSDRLVADETPIERVSGSYGIVLANIEAAPLAELAPAIMARLAPGAMLVLSGILAPEVAPAQVASLEKAYGGVTLDEVRQKGEWVAMVWTAAPTSSSR